MNALPTRNDSGIMLARFSEVHRDTGRGVTVCGQKMVNPISVTDRDVLCDNLSRCHRCYPDWSIHRGRR